MLNISIITVSFNSVDVIDNCLSSVANQSYEHVEHVLIDGASTDGTIEKLLLYRKQSDIFVSEHDTGIYDAMNKGIKLSHGDIIGFLNSDDFYATENVLSEVASMFSADPLLDACYSDLVYTDRMEPSRIMRYWKSDDFVFKSFSKGWCPPHPTFFARRSVYERFGTFNLRYRIASDVELMMRFLEVQRIRVQYVPKIWVKMRVGGTTNKSLKNIWLQNLEVLYALRLYKLPSNVIYFFAHKFLSRSKQFFQSPTV